MDELFRSVHDFLADPAAQRDEFDASDALIWVDWGDEDESVLSYLNDVLHRLTTNARTQRRSAALISC